MLATMVVLPWDTAVTKPKLGAMLDTLATFKLREFHVAACVRSTTEPSEYVPVAANCWVPLSPNVAVGGVKARLTSVAEVTLTGRLALWPRYVTVMLQVPLATALTVPRVFPVLVTVAIAGSFETQLAVWVKF